MREHVILVLPISWPTKYWYWPIFIGYWVHQGFGCIQAASRDFWDARHENVSQFFHRNVDSDKITVLEPNLEPCDTINHATLTKIKSSESIGRENEAKWAKRDFKSSIGQYQYIGTRWPDWYRIILGDGWEDIYCQYIGLIGYWFVLIPGLKLHSRTQWIVGSAAVKFGCVTRNTQCIALRSRRFHFRLS